MEDFETSNAEDATQRLSGFDGMPKNEAAHIKETDLFVPGNLFLGKYSIKEKIGEGGMGVVYRCSQVFISKDLAIKTLNSGSLNDEAIQRFQTEAKAAGALYHPNIVAVHDFGVTESGTPYMVMDYVPGKTLHDVLSVRGQLSLETVIDIFAQCSDALAHAHSKGVFHRDIKPSNIVLLQEESIGPGAIRILDFGIAKITSNSAQTQELTKTGTVIGSPLYMSPEQSIGKRIDGRTDIYSLGCVLFECLCGAPPFQGDSVIETLMLHQTEQPKTLREASLGRDFPAGLQELVDSMMAKSVEDRIESMSRVHEILADIKETIRTDKSDNTIARRKEGKTSIQVNNGAVARSTLLNTKAIIAILTAIVLSVAAFVILQLMPQEKSEPVKPLQMLDARFATPEIERASYDQKVKRALTESRGYGWEHTSISSCEFSDTQFEMLARARWLKKLTLLECSRLTPEGIRKILSGNIEYLDLRGSELNDESVEAIAKYGAKLRFLGLSKCGNISSKALKSLARLTDMDTLDLSSLPLSDDVLKVIVDGMTKLRELGLANIPYIGDHSCRILARHKGTWGFNLSSTSVSDEGLKYLRKNVYFIYLGGNPRITDRGVETLIKNCPNLNVLHIPGASISPQVIFKMLAMKDLKDLLIGTLDADNETRIKIREIAKARKINIYTF
ncbi:MAG TPA: protein kinase [Candidatus Melainabacteria bacterium]|nr:protein kinase [Candidatus Melainabacteria bacterium]